DWAGIPVQALNRGHPRTIAGMRSNACASAMQATTRLRDRFSRIVCGDADKRSISFGSDVLDFWSDFRSSGASPFRPRAVFDSQENDRGFLLTVMPRPHQATGAIRECKS